MGYDMISWFIPERSNPFPRPQRGFGVCSLICQLDPNSLLTGHLLHFGLRLWLYLIHFESTWKFNNSNKLSIWWWREIKCTIWRILAKYRDRLRC